MFSLLHITVVFLIPLFFGWITVRRLFSETRLELLVPASALVGFAALMAIVNELRFFMEMKPALWTGYKALVAGGLLVLLLCPSRGGRLVLSPQVSGIGRVAVVLATCAFAAVYFGVPAFKGFLHDSWWSHYPIALQAQNLPVFPLRQILGMEEMLYYHYGPDLLAAAWSTLLSRPVAFGFALNIAILAPLTFLMTFGLVLRGSRSFLTAFVSGVLVLLAGNLRFVDALFSFGQPIGMLQSLNSQTVEGLLEMIFTPSHAFGVPMVLCGVALWQKSRIRPNWWKTIAIGLYAGALTLAAEWYFVLFFAAMLLFPAGRCAARVLASKPLRWRFLPHYAAPLVLALLVAFSNNTYLAGYLASHWVMQGTLAAKVPVRLLEWRVAQARTGEESMNPEEVTTADVRAGMKIPASSVVAPGLVPVRFNWAHLGRVPSWEAAGSKGQTHVPLLGWRFLSEALPVLLIGLPGGWVLWRRFRRPSVAFLAIMGTLAVFPPVFLEFGYRPADFLRFFTAAFSFSAVLFGWFLVHQWMSGGRIVRVATVLLLTAALTNPVLLGAVGLMPRAFAAVERVSSTGESLSEVSDGLVPENRSESFNRLAVAAGDVLFPYARGVDRVAVLVPAEQLPPLDRFPEWMKMATLSRIRIPISTYALSTLYSQYYTKIVDSLAPDAIAALDVRWVIASNLFQEKLPPAVDAALADPTRFIEVAFLKDGKYWLRIYRTL